MSLLFAGSLLVWSLSSLQFMEPQTSALGVTYYVSPTGTGTSTSIGAPGSASDTIAALCGVGPGAGDTILFLDGTYNTADASVNTDGRTIRIENKNCGTAANYVVFQAQNKHAAIININGLAANGTDAAAFKPINSSYIRFQDFFIEGNQQSGQLWGPGVETQSSHHIEIVGNHIEDTVGGGVTTQQSTHIYIADNDILRGAWQHPNCSSNISFYQHHNPTSIPDDANGYSNYIVNNRIYSSDNLNFSGCYSAQPSDGNCVIIDVSNELAHYTNRTLVANNVCVDNGGRGLQSLSSSHIDFYNNTVYLNAQTTQPYTSNLMVTCDDRDSGVGSTDINFIGNVVQRNPGTDSFRSAQFNTGNDCPLSANFQNNVFIDDDLSTSTFAGGISMTTTTDPNDLNSCGANNLVSAAAGQVGFINPTQDITTADFDIPLTSILVDRGCPLPSVITADIDGEPRLSRAQNDIGAHERQNTTPSDISMTNAVINENSAANSAVGILSTTDADGIDTHTYSFVGGAGDADNAAFNISGNTLSLTSTADYESQSSYSVRVQTSDQYAATYEEVFSVLVTDLNDPPTDIQLSNASLTKSEATLGRTVGTLTATDDGEDNGSISYSLVSGTGGTNNSQFSISGNQLLTAATLATGSYSVRIQASDGSTSYEEAFTVAITADAQDTDGTDNEVENAGPNSGDANGDGKLDSSQSNVSAIPNPFNAANKNAYASLSVPGLATAIISNYSFIAEPTDNPNTDKDYPLGLIDFTISNIPVGSTQTIVITLDQTYDTSSWEWHKYTVSDGKYAVLPNTANLAYATASIGGSAVTTVTYDIVDGGALDADGIANGVIVDPSGPAVASSVSSPTTDEETADSSEKLANTGIGTRTSAAAGAILFIGTAAITVLSSRQKYTLK